MNTTGLRPDAFARLTCRPSCSVIVAIKSSLRSVQHNAATRVCPAVPSPPRASIPPRSIPHVDRDREKILGSAASRERDDGHERCGPLDTPGEPNSLNLYETTPEPGRDYMDYWSRSSAANTSKRACKSPNVDRHASIMLPRRPK
jgi:hypothetical protein